MNGSTKTSRMSSRQAWTLALASIGAFIVALDALVVSTALSSIRVHLGASIEELEWVVNAYTLTFAVLLMTGAALGERFGRRRMFVAGLGLFGISSALCALAPSASWLIAARALQGCGAALVMPLAVTLVSAAFPPEQRGRALGAFSGVAGLAVLSGPVVGGAITQAIAWQWIFWLNVPIALLAIPLVRARITESFGAKTKLDVPGIVLVTGGALGLVWGLVRGNGAGWGSAEVVGTLVVGAALTAAFVLWELRSATPMLPMRLFRIRAFAAGDAAAVLFFGSLNGGTFFFAQFLQTAQHETPFVAGLKLLPWTVMLFVMAPLSGALMNRLGERVIIVGALVLQGIALCWIALIARPDLPYAQLILPLVIAGFGSAAIPAVQNAVISAVPPQAIGQASGTFNMLRQLGVAFGVAIIAALFSSAGSYRTPTAFSHGLTVALLGAAALAFAAALVGLLLPGRRVAATPSAVRASERAPEPVAVMAD